MLLRASRGESTGDSKEDSLLALGEVRDSDGLELAGRVEVRKSGLRKLIADGKGGGDGGFGGRRRGESEGFWGDTAGGIEGKGREGETGRESGGSGGEERNGRGGGKGEREPGNGERGRHCCREMGSRGMSFEWFWFW